MFIVLHVVLALSALAVAAYANIRPSDTKLKLSYGLAVGTLTSGVLLIIINHASILRTCLSGIIFFGAVSGLNEIARRKLVSYQKID